MPKALVLSGGGARAAFQIGVLRRVAELIPPHIKKCPFPILCGTSAGAVNVAAIASNFENFAQSVHSMEKVWSSWQVHHVYRTDVGSLFKISTQWMRDIGFGGMLGAGHIKSLLDTTPLRRLLKTLIEFEKI